MQIKSVGKDLSAKISVKPGNTDCEFSVELQNSAQKLEKLLRQNKGFLTCGMGKVDNGECIYIYVKDKETKNQLQTFEEKGFEGFKVLVIEMGQVEFA